LLCCIFSLVNEGCNRTRLQLRASLGPDAGQEGVTGVGRGVERRGRVCRAAAGWSVCFGYSHAGRISVERSGWVLSRSGAKLLDRCDPCQSRWCAPQTTLNPSVDSVAWLANTQYLRALNVWPLHPCTVSTTCFCTRDGLLTNRSCESSVESSTVDAMLTRAVAHQWCYLRRLGGAGASGLSFELALRGLRRAGGPPRSSGPSNTRTATSNEPTTVRPRRNVSRAPDPPL
jgi:hypothetical protein